MLFPSKYVNHSLEKMQKYMDYIFFKIWVKAKDLGDFDLSLFDKNKDLQDIIRYFNYDENSPKYGKKFVEHTMKIFKIFKTLNSYHIKLLTKWYISNNNIKEICRGNKKPIRYKDIYFNVTLKNELKELYSNLYEQNYLGLKNIEEHYKEFCKVNTKKICPFCGLKKMKCNLHSKREAYDHYLPKEKYPFNSINFHNLVPTCNDCNSSYKLRKDPLYLQDREKRKAFYPFITYNFTIEIAFKINTTNYTNISPENIELSITSSKKEEIKTWKEEIKTWKEIYGIDERYKAICSYEDEGKYWLDKILFEADDKKDVVWELIQKHNKLSPYSDHNFLQVPFLEACKKKGII